ncbi:MAG: hypothetical protein WC759_00505 [Candidatus Micrarchaeia archaeon]|jgi:hypothetical protein
MRPLQALAFLLFLSQLISALSLNEFLAPYMLPGERPVAEDFSAGNSNYALVRIAGKPTFLLEVQDDQFSFVQDAGQMEEVLRSKVLGEVALTESLDSSLHLLQEFNNSRLLGEKECRRQTGTDRLPCIDKESCIVACRSVPNCQTALSYNIDSINAIRDWLSISSQLNARVADAEQSSADASSALGTSFDTAPLDSLLADEYDVQTLAANVSANPLFNCAAAAGGKCFCADTSNSTMLRASIDLLLRVRSNLTLFQTLPGLSSSIATATAQRTSIKDEGGRYALVLSESEAALKNLRQEIDNSLFFIRDDELLMGFNELRSNLTTLSVAVGQKDYVRAEKLTLAFNTKLEILRSRTGANMADYYLLLDLRLNVSRTLDLLSSMGLNDAQLEQLASLQARFNSSDIPSPVSRVLADSLKTDLLDQQADSTTLFTNAERTRIEREISDARATIAELKLLSEANKQPSNFTPALQELDEAQRALTKNDLKTAGAIADATAYGISQSKDALNQKVARIAIARKEISAMQAEVDAAASTRFAILQPNMGAANAALEEARSLLYADPDAAVLAAQRIPDLVKGALDSAQSLNQLATIAAVVLGLIVIVGALHWIYKREEQ